MGNTTYRVVDGERVKGTWRRVFVHNLDYHLADLFVFADGAIYCWDWLDLDGLRERLESGRIRTHLEPGARVYAHGLGAWRFDDPHDALTPEMLLGEVADEIDRLNDRPDSIGRCRQALDRYLETRTEKDRQALRAAYLAIPEHRRVYTLGDMDFKDFPLVVLCTDLGEPLLVHRREGPTPVVTEEMREKAFAYFADREAAKRAYPRRAPADEPESQPKAIHISQSIYPNGWPTKPGLYYLQNEYPAPIEVGSTTYPTVTHAYWALSTTDREIRERIREADNPFEAERLARDAPRTPSWPEARAAIMATLLRAKFRQHPHLAEYLVGTGDARIHYGGLDSPYWSTGGEAGRNWMGRLLELVRSEFMIEHVFDRAPRLGP